MTVPLRLADTHSSAAFSDDMSGSCICGHHRQCHHIKISMKSLSVYTDVDKDVHSDPVLHIELRYWANILVSAPVDAKLPGKISSGICDNLLICVVQAWDTNCLLLFCLAMNTAMRQYPLTAQHVTTLKGIGYIEIICITKKLVCGDGGKGAMAEVSNIVNTVKQYLQKPAE